MPNSLTVNFSLCFLTLLALGDANANPEITQVTYDVPASELIIRGDNFGGGPEHVFSDSFLNGVSGERISLKSPDRGAWLTNNNGRYTTKDALFGDTSAIAFNGLDSEEPMNMVFGTPNGNEPRGLDTFQQIFLSYSIRDVGAFPGSKSAGKGFSTTSSTKDAWLMLGNRGDNTNYSKKEGSVPDGHDLHIASWPGSSFHTGGNNTKLVPSSFWHQKFEDYWSFSGWNTFSFYAKLDSSHPYSRARGFVKLISSNGQVIDVRDGNLMSDQSESGLTTAAWDRVKFGAWYRSNSPFALRLMDGVYVATGENILARVLLSNAADPSDATIVYYAAPEEWDDDLVEATLPTEVFGSAEAWYVFVSDSEGKLSGGKELCPQCPGPPTRVRRPNRAR